YLLDRQTPSSSRTGDQHELVRGFFVVDQWCERFPHSVSRSGEDRIQPAGLRESRGFSGHSFYEASANTAMFSSPRLIRGRGQPTAAGCVVLSALSYCRSFPTPR